MGRNSVGYVSAKVALTPSERESRQPCRHNLLVFTGKPRLRAVKPQREGQECGRVVPNWQAGAVTSSAEGWCRAGKPERSLGAREEMDRERERERERKRERKNEPQRGALVGEMVVPFRLAEWVTR